jgi:hypothetical protein
MTTATRYKNSDLIRSAQARGIYLGMDDANTLRRAELTLHGWAEQECGDANGNAIERDEITDKPYMTSDFGTQWMSGRRTRRPIPDREKGALRRVQAVCTRLGLYFHHQTDPRGCALYISSEPLTDSAYTNGIACSR